MNIIVKKMDEGFPFDDRWMHPNDAEATLFDALWHFLNEVKMVSFATVTQEQTGLVRRGHAVHRTDAIQRIGPLILFGGCFIIPVPSIETFNRDIVTHTPVPVFVVRPFSFAERQNEKEQYLENYRNGKPAIYIPYETLEMYVTPKINQ